MSEPVDQPRIRKRSELGRAKPRVSAEALTASVAEEAAKVFGEADTSAAKVAQPSAYPVGFAGSGDGVDENISAFTDALNKAGFGVTLLQTAAWGRAQRDLVRAWLISKDLSRVPACLVELVAPAKAKEVAVPMPSRIDPLPSKMDVSIFEPLSDALQKQGLLYTANVIALWSDLQRDVVRCWLEQGSLEEDRPAILVRPVTTVDGSVVVTKFEPRPAPVVKAADVKPTWPTGAGLAKTPVPEGSGLAKTTAKPAPAVPKVSPADNRENLPASWGGKPEIRAPKSVTESQEYNRFIETVLQAVDMDAEFDDLRKHLEVGEHKDKYPVVYDALDKAESMAFRASGLHANALLEHERLRLDQKEVDADLWNQAMNFLETEAKKTRIKDVEATIAELFPDEWRRGKMRMKRSELAIQRTQEFKELWSSKVRSLRTMLETMRRA
jgi:hypothetical protein